MQSREGTRAETKVSAGDCPCISWPCTTRPTRAGNRGRSTTTFLFMPCQAIHEYHVPCPVACCIPSNIGLSQNQVASKTSMSCPYLDACKFHSPFPCDTHHAAGWIESHAVLC